MTGDIKDGQIRPEPGSNKEKPDRETIELRFRQDQDSPKVENAVLYNPPLYVHPRSKDYADGSTRIYWKYMFIWSVIMVILSALLMAAFVATCILLRTGLEAIFGNAVDLSHIFIFGLFATIGLFISGLIFVMGYFSSPFAISEIGGKAFNREYFMGLERYQWSYAIYNLMLKGDRRSRAVFCFTYLLPYMLMYGGFFLVLGILLTGIFGPIAPFSFYILVIGMLIWIGMVACGFYLGRRLMKKFVREGTIRGSEPFPSPKDFML